MHNGLLDQGRGRGQAREVASKSIKVSSTKTHVTSESDFCPCNTCEKQDAVVLICHKYDKVGAGTGASARSSLASYPGVRSTTVTRETLPQSRVEGKNQLTKIVFHEYMMLPLLSLHTQLKEEKTEEKE